jgi:tyrosyl-tRNA synthetase
MISLQELRWRGLIQDISDEAGVENLVAGDGCYVGFDPTAKSLHIGNLVSILVAIHLGRAGLKPVLLFGGATGAIGDPSGKRAERQLLERAVVDANVAAISAQVGAIMHRSGVTADFVDNYSWTREVTLLDFLRDIGKHFTVNYMLAKDSVKARLEGDGISFTEFSYMLLQSFDFLHLYTTRNCKLQFGGSDQWGNITAGLELIRRKVQGEAFALSAPLILDSQGRKFGKSEGGAVWLDPELTSPFKFHQFWLNVPDADVVRYLKIFTLLSLEEIAALEAKMLAAPAERAGQKALADAVTTLIHGSAATEDAKRSAQVLFGGSFDGLSESQLEEIFADVPSSTLNRGELGGLTIVDALVNSKTLASKGEARRLITSGGVYLNNERVSDPALIISSALKADTGLFLMRTGKKNYHLVKIAG